MVQRQSTLCRFSNCSKREETEERWSVPGEEPEAERAPRCLSSCIQVDGTLQKQESFARKSCLLIVRTTTGFQQSNLRHGVPEGYLYEQAYKQKRRPGGYWDAVSFDSWPNQDWAKDLALGSSIRLGVLLEEVERSRFFGGKLGGFRNLLDGSRSGHFREQLDAAIVLEAGSRGDEAAHDDVFLEAAEIVHLAGDRPFREGAGGFLEARGGDERIGRQRRLGDPKEKWTARCRAAAIGDDAIVFLAEAELVDLLLEEELCVTDVLDLDPAHHLARDRLDVLVVDVHALEPVNLLNGVDQVRLRELLAQDSKQVVHVERTTDEALPGLPLF